MRLTENRSFQTFLTAALLTVGSKAYTETAFEYSFGALSDDYFGRGEQVGQTAFNGLTLSASGSSGQLDYSLSLATQMEDPSDGIPGFDLGLRFANDTWKTGVSKEQRHWSPSRYTSLILSRNAEYIPAIYLRKSEATQSRSKLLSWLGKFRGEFFVGQTNDSLNGDYAVFVGNQFALQPIRNLEIELVRTIQLGGSGQNADADLFLRALIGETNEGAASSVNQMAGIGVSYTFDQISRPIRIYGQIVGEDEAGGLPTCLIDLAGVEIEAPLFGAHSTLTLENVDTQTSYSTNGFCGQTAAYNNGVYDYTNSEKVLGAAIDTASSSLTLRGTHEFSNWALNWSLGQNNINEPSSPGHRLSSTNVEGVLASIGTELPFAKGTLGTMFVFQEFDLDNVGLSDGFYFGLNYSGRF